MLNREGSRVTAGTAIVWLRNDLRLADSPALATAADAFGTVAPVFIFSPAEANSWAPGSASRAWLALSLKSLSSDIEGLGGRLTILSGPTIEALLTLALRTGASAVYWHRRYEPAGAALDAEVARQLESAGLEVHVMDGSLIHEPDALVTGSGTPFQVFTPFFNASLRAGMPDYPLPTPVALPAPANLPVGIPPEEVAAGLTEAPDVARFWSPGESGARALADRFFHDIADEYAQDRDRPDLDGTSRLSPHLAFGEISARVLRAEATEMVKCNGTCHIKEGAAAFIRQLYWREFAYHLLHHHPSTTDRPLRSRFDVFPWSRDPIAMEAWQSGMTGYPIVDAGMRELLATGWMHNRVRMLVASLLTKDLLLPWADGAHWFWERLVDADLANNTFGWQWVAGCGADAAPYFRIFNPVLQGERFDPDGAYAKKWVPELEALPAAWVHRPWVAPSGVLASAGITLGREYPRPIVDHTSARLRALAIYGSLRDIVK
jgi:deoxyribodipyrimidine photo-lyase